MAIQNRRGIYSDFDPTKMVEGEFAIVQSGDPNTSDGKAVYIAPTTGTAERVALYKDLQQEVQAAITDATDEVIQEVTAGIIEGVAEDVTKAETAATNAETSAQNAEASAEEAQEILENKADNNGYYPDLYAGNLSSTKKQTDSIPYLMRKTGGDLSRIGEREDDTLVGATVNVNQLYDVGYVESRTINGVTFTVQADGSILADGTATGYDVYYAVTKEVYALNHVLFLAGCPNGGSKDTYRIYLDGHGVASYDVGNGTIFKQTQDNNRRVFIYVRSGVTVESKVFKPKVIDLTQMFGSTIADYLYSLEQTTAGAGIAKLREWGFLTDEYIPYNAGTLESVEATAHKMVGFNQWDEETESGYVNPQTGAEVVDSTKIRMKNFMPVLPNTTYYKKSPTTFWNVYFDADKNYIGYGNAGINQTFTTPNNCRYIRCGFESAYGTTYNHDICINLSSDRNGEYEPYSAHTYDLGTDTLRGLFKLDSNNELYADGDRKTSDGVVTRKYPRIDLGTLNWTYWNGLFYADVSGKKSTNTECDILCSKYASYPTNFSNASSASINMSDKQIAGFVGTGASSYVYAKDAAYTDAAAFKTAMSGVYLVYELATPTTEQSTPFTNPQICDPDGTEEYVTSNGVPVGHETKYDYDIKGLAEELIDVPDVPSSNGTYVLKATRSASGISYEWVSEA